MPRILLFILIPLFALGATVKDVEIGALDPRRGTAQVTYTVECSENEAPQRLRALVVDTATGKAIHEATLSHTGSGPLSPGRHTVRWNMLTDAPTIPFSQLTLLLFPEEMPAEPKEQQSQTTEHPKPNQPVEPPKPVVAIPDLPFGDPLYLVIDLSGGPQATSYPFSTLSTPPAIPWPDEYKTNKLVLRRIEPGTFIMGCPDDEIGHCAWEPQHEVTLTHPYYIGVFEVTQKQWELVMGSNPSTFTHPDFKDMRPVDSVSYQMVRGRHLGAQWPQSGNVDPDSFLGVLRSKLGDIPIDLPTEAQWEYACRAGTTTSLNSGKNLLATEVDAGVAELGRYKFNGGQNVKAEDGIDHGTTTVGMFPPNAWCLYDMHGNVLEWCLDACGHEPPMPQTDPVGPWTGGVRVYRGGGWNSEAKYCRSGYHAGDVPSANGGDHGFRLCVTVSPPAMK